MPTQVAKVGVQSGTVNAEVPAKLRGGHLDTAAVGDWAQGGDVLIALGKALERRRGRRHPDREWLWNGDEDVATPIGKGSGTATSTSPPRSVGYQRNDWVEASSVPPRSRVAFQAVTSPT
jgi:hypothetical protein